MSDPTRYEVRFDPKALRDLRDIVAYRAQERGSENAAALAQAIQDRTDTLETFPYRGSVPKELLAAGDSMFRQVLYRHYRIIYAVFGATALVLLIVDGRRDVRTLLQERGLAPDPPA